MHIVSKKIINYDLITLTPGVRDMEAHTNNSKLKELIFRKSIFCIFFIIKNPTCFNYNKHTLDTFLDPKHRYNRHVDKISSAI